MKSSAIVTLALLAATPALAQQGVTANEIVIGTAQDLSGPIVALSKPAVNGMRMRIDEINAEGGVHGRKLRLVVEDHGYDPKKAVLAAQKLVQQDQIFAALGSIGTPTAVAADADPISTRKVAHLLSAHRRARNVRADAPAEIFVRDAVITTRSRARDGSALIKDKNPQQDLHDLPGRRLRSRGDARRRAGAQRTSAWSYGGEDHPTSAARPTSPRRSPKMKEAGCDGRGDGAPIIRETIGTIADRASARTGTRNRRHHGELLRHHPQARRRGG